MTNRYQTTNPGGGDSAVAPANSSVPATRLPHALLLLLIAGMTFLAYSNTFQAPFVFDDIPRIVENHQIRDLNNFLNLRMLRAPRPLVDFSFALNYHFHGLEVWGYHLVNLLIHIFNGWLVYALTLHCARVLCFSVPPSRTPIPQHVMAFTAALLFTLHPIQTQAVTYVVQRYTSLAAFFYLAAVLCYILGRRIQLREGVSGTAARVVPLKAAACFVLVPLCGILAFLSKQHAASLPAAIILLELILFDRSWAAWKRRLIWMLPAVGLFLLFVLYSVGFFARAGGQGLLEDVSRLMQETGAISRSTYLFTQFQVICRYLLLLLAPTFQSLDHLYPFVSSFWSSWTPLALGFLLLLLAAAALSIRRFPLVTLGIGWLFITLSVESSIIPIRDAMFEHRMYLPMAGLAILSSQIWRIPWAYSRKGLTGLVVGLVLLAAGAGAWQRNGVWQDQARVWEDALKKNPANHRAHVNLGEILDRRGQRSQAYMHYHEALRLRPHYPLGHLNMGALKSEHNRLEEAEYHYRVALEGLPDSAAVHSNLGAVLMRMDRADEGMNHLRMAINLDPFFVEGQYNLGVALVQTQALEAAAKQLQRVLELEPRHADALRILQHLQQGAFAAE